MSVETREIDQILHSETGHNTIFKLKLGDESRDVLIKDYQLDPVKGVLIHADLQTVSMDQKMAFDVPVQIEGTAEGVKMGGILDLVTREIHVECLPSDVPDHIHIEVTDLNIGDALRVENLTMATDKVSILSDPELVVLVIVPPAVEEEEVAEEAAEEIEGAEPEVIKKGKAEEEEGAETEGKDDA